MTIVQRRTGRLSPPLPGDTPSEPSRPLERPSRQPRESVEVALKDPARPTTAVATSTLEMGIDVGSVTSIAQIGPTPSVSALRERLGRSGRRGDPAVLRTYISETSIDPRTSVTDQLRNGLVQATAMVLLLLEGFCEPPTPAALHSSTLVQQLLSLIAQHSGTIPAEARSQLCGASGPFSETSPERFTRILWLLADRDVIEQVPDGTLLLAQAGDRIVNHYDFYTAFKTPVEYRLLHAGQLVGTKPIDYPLHTGDRIIFSGTRWKVADVYNRKRTIELTPPQEDSLRCSEATPPTSTTTSANACAPCSPQRTSRPSSTPPHVNCFGKGAPPTAASTSGPAVSSR